MKPFTFTLRQEPSQRVDLSALTPDRLAGKSVAEIEEIEIGVTRVSTKVGDVFTTKVTRIADFGAFVELKGGGEGLVHVSNLADGFVDNVTDYVKVGDEVTIEVIGTDKMGRPDLKRIAPEGEAPPRGDRDRKPRRDRGRRGGAPGREPRSEPAPPSKPVREGDIIEGVVTNTTDYGAFVELTPEVTGLIHISALSDEYVRRVTDVVKSGDRVTVEVMNIDDRGRYKLRRVVPDGERREAEEAPEVGEEPEVEAEVEAEREGRTEKPEREAEEEAPPEFEDRW